MGRGVEAWDLDGAGAEEGARGWGKGGGGASDADGGDPEGGSCGQIRPGKCGGVGKLVSVVSPWSVSDVEGVELGSTNQVSSDEGVCALTVKGIDILHHSGWSVDDGELIG